MRSVAVLVMRGAPAVVARPVRGVALALAPGALAVPRAQLVVSPPARVVVELAKVS